MAAQAGSAYYHVNNQTWMDTVGTYTINRKVSSLGVREGDVITVQVVAVPEFYETAGELRGEDVWHCCNRASWVQAPALPPP